jgi:hypothetical protein
MKTIICALGLLAAVVISSNFIGDRAEAQPPVAESSRGTPPIGNEVEVTLVAWAPESASQEKKFSGKLLLMNQEWLVIQEGTFENWLPRERVFFLKASK